ncbi:MAG: hypothetical protein SGPRY_010992, partial [Prymnesium sp.]
YAGELASPNPRAWVVSHARSGWSCYQSDEEVVANVQALLRENKHLYEDRVNASWLNSPSLRRLNLSTLSSFYSIVDSNAPHMSTAVRDVLVDQLVCSRANMLLLNAYSTFSQLVMGRMGMEASSRVGWTRDLSASDQKRLG